MNIGRRLIPLAGVLGAGLALSPAARAEEGGTVYGGERFTHSVRPESVLRVAVSCDAAEGKDDTAKAPDAWNLLVAGKKTGRIGRVSPAAPDDIPLDLFLVVPRDPTMLDAHEDLMEQLTELPYWMNALGHRRHRVHILSYSGCSGSLIAGEGATRLEPHTGRALSGGVETGKPRAMAAVIEAVKQDTTAEKGVCPKFEGADFGALIKDLTTMFTGSFALGAKERGRILAVIHDGRVVADPPAFRGPEVQKLLELFDSLLVLQPDIAPQVWAREVYRGSGPAGRLAQRFFRERIAQDLMRDCVELRGREACLAADQAQARNEAATQVMGMISPRTLTGSINHRQFVTRSSLITLLSGSARIGSQGYTVKQKEVDDAFKRPTKLDQLGCHLAEAGRGGLELLGGYPGQKRTCEVASQEGEAPATMAEIIHRHSPFAKAYTVEVCLDEGKEKLEGPVSYRLELAGGLCVSGERDFKASAGTPSDRLSPDALVQSICGAATTEGASASPCPAGQVCAAEGGSGLDLKWVGLIGVVALIGGFALARRGR
jgi:hypothetical protein